MRWLFVFLAWVPFASADPVADIENAATAAFASMPSVQTLPEIASRCGVDETVNDQIAYCTSQNVIFLTQAARSLPEAAYLVAHAYGHAVQVRHGVADFALGQIRSRPDEETMLRGLVERQVDCIAGFLMHKADLPPAALTDWFTDDPFADIHWGRDPLRIGPQISIALDARNTWFQIGQGGDLAACAPGEFTSDLLVAALR